MRSYTVTYEELKATATRSGKCPGCGKAVRRSRTFTNTVSPFNLIEDKSRPKTRAEVQQAVNEKARNWRPSSEIFWHDKCLDKEAN